MANGDLGDVLNVVRTAGVRRVVLLSSQGVGTQRHPSGLEDAVKQSGLEWTILRPGNFDSNALQWAGSVRARRVVAAPFGAVALPAIDLADIAEVAAVALREPRHGGGIYTLTGPVPISPRQQATAIGDALGEPVRFVEQSRADARDQMLGYMPERVVEATLGALGTPSAAEQRVGPGVERLLGAAAPSLRRMGGTQRRGVQMTRRIHLPASAQALPAEPRPATLMTVRPDGSPHVVAARFTLRT